MLRSLIGCALVSSAALLTGCGTMSTEDAAARMAENACSRGELRGAVDSYLAAQRAGDPALLFVSNPFDYKEQFQTTAIETGIINEPLAIDFDHTILDQGQCETFSEIVVTDPEHPYVLGVHLSVEDGAITEIDTIVTDDDDWLFSAELFLAGIQDEDWGPIPAADRDSRETIIAASDPYFPMFIDTSIQPPWHEPCYRQEGAMRTNGTCYLTEPLNVEFGQRHWVVDTTTGSAAALVFFNNDLPDSHTFRVEDGKVRYIHTITNCMGDFNCNFDLPANLAEERRARGGMLGPEG